MVDAGENRSIACGNETPVLGELTAPHHSLQARQIRSLLLPSSPDDSPLVVEVDDAVIAKITRGATATILTRRLAGCTAIAGLQVTDEVILAGLAHYSPTVDIYQRPSLGGCHSARFMNEFSEQAKDNGAETCELVVVYGQEHASNPEYGVRTGSYEDWFFLDQLEETAKLIGDNVDVQLVPYTGYGHSICVNVRPKLDHLIVFE